MNDSKKGVKEISLIQSLEGEWLKLPVAIMIDAGPAVQTFAGFLRITNSEAYVAVEKIARSARLPIGTVRRHLVTLHKHGWITNEGRGHTRTGRPRRTCTIRITNKAKSALADYAILPWWSCNWKQWSAKALLAAVMSRLAATKKAIASEVSLDKDDDPEDFWLYLSGLEQEHRFRFSIEALHKATGLWRQALVSAKQLLQRWRVIELIGRQNDDGGDAADLIVPNWAFRVVVTPKTESKCTTHFKVLKGWSPEPGKLHGV